MFASILIPQIHQYLSTANLGSLPHWDPQATTTVSLLAQGEYNINYRVQQGSHTWVLRLNQASQINRPDQICYEYQALSLLAASGLTPRPYAVDDSRTALPLGLLWMEYLPGDPLDYGRDLAAAAHLFAKLHSYGIPTDTDHGLILEEAPLSMVYKECCQLLQTYFESDLADPDLRQILQTLRDWGEAARHQETYFYADPWPCVINTEVNSGNFIANRAARTLHLVDWEKPLWGDPSQDLSHFCAATTTLWKTSYRLSEAEKQDFLDHYRQGIRDPHLRDTIQERVRLRDPFTLMRGISWSAMAWVAYQTGSHANRNPDTFLKICDYLQPEFLRDIFRPFVRL